MVKVKKTADLPTLSLFVGTENRFINDDKTIPEKAIYTLEGGGTEISSIKGYSVDFATNALSLDFAFNKNQEINLKNYIDTFEVNLPLKDPDLHIYSSNGNNKMDFLRFKSLLIESASIDNSRGARSFNTVLLFEELEIEEMVK